MIKKTFKFLKDYKKWWLTPMIIVIIVFLILIVLSIMFSKNSQMPFYYALF
ncbi:hypothetical protein HN789_00815 [archaeon]|jgi:hypothetical protein|nr:hypothetical protein [archaeon]MBT4461481.1 hypothetical protein [archaeon]MBT5424360.1 hypothetical protein [archaeon]MBT6772953.1 hypothetical protein [archaeon]MBT7439760.1 hypothetical protein [archaeon]